MLWKGEWDVCRYKLWQWNVLGSFRGPKEGVKKGKIDQKNHNFLQKTKKYSAAYSYNGLEIVSQILTGLKQGSGMLFVAGHIPLWDHKRDKSAKLPLNYKYTPL